MLRRARDTAIVNIHPMAALTKGMRGEEMTELGLLKANPFDTVDVDGVGELIRIATERGRASKPTLKVGICGEHGGEPASVKFCHEIGLTYVSCSPFRVPIARLAAAQAALADAS